MSEIKAFRAVIFNPQRLKYPQKLISPPYDIIAPDEEKTYRNRSRYNIIHLTLPQSAGGKNKYQSAADRFENWIKSGILLQDQDPAIFFYRQEFSLGKKRKTRLGLFASLSLSDTSTIYKHEQTRPQPKKDRFRLLAKVGANLEPLFMLFPDRRQTINSFFKNYVKPDKPWLRFQDAEKNTHILWRLSSQRHLGNLKKIMAKKNLFLADGHHRYEACLSYGCDYLLAYFCPFKDPGLVLKPILRLVKGINSLPNDKINKYFRIRKSSRRKVFNLINPGAATQRSIGAYANKNFYIFTLKKTQYLNKIDRAYRNLDISLLNHLVFEKIFGINPQDEKKIIFSADAQDLLRQADLNPASWVFFIKPPQIKDIVYLAKAEKLLPAKTTYFYPKVPSGLVMYKFNEDTI